MFFEFNGFVKGVVCIECCNICVLDSFFVGKFGIDLIGNWIVIMVEYL